MTERRRGLGRGLGALIPAAPAAVDAHPEYAADGEGRDLVGTDGVSARGTVPGSVLGIGALRPLADGDGGTDHGAPATGGGQDAAGSRSTTPDVPGAHFAEVPVDAIRPNPQQPREVFDEDALEELVQSIREVGLLQPIVVRPAPTEHGGYELVMGERRWRAAQEAGLAAIPAIVRETSDDLMLLDALLENLHRAQLNPLEEAAAYEQLLEEFGCTHEQLADRIGRSRSQVSNTIRLLKLPAAVQKRVAAGVLSAGHARALLGVADPEEQDRLAYRIVAEGLSVRAVEEIVALGERSRAPRRPRAGRRVNPGLAELATRLSDHFDTRVKVDLGQKKGKIVIEFASIEDLDRIVANIAPAGGDQRGSGILHGWAEQSAASTDDADGAAEAAGDVESSVGATVGTS